MVNDLKSAQRKYEFAEMFQAAEANLKQQILDIGKPDHKVKAIVSKYGNVTRSILSIAMNKSMSNRSAAWKVTN